MDYPGDLFNYRVGASTKLNDMVVLDSKNNDGSSTFIMVDSDNKTKTILEFLKYLEELKRVTKNESVLESIQDCCDSVESLLDFVKNPPPEVDVEWDREKDQYSIKLSYEAYEALKIYIDSDLNIEKNKEKLCVFLKEHIMDLIKSSTD